MNEQQIRELAEHMRLAMKEAARACASFEPAMQQAAHAFDALGAELYRQRERWQKERCRPGGRVVR